MAEGQPQAYAMGWVTRTYNDIPVIRHDGDTDNSHAEIILIPDGQWGVVLLANGSHFALTARFEQLASGVISLLVGRQPRDYNRPNGVLLGIYLALVTIPAAQVVWATWAVARQGRKGRSASRPRDGWRVLVLGGGLPLAANLAITSALLLALLSLFGGPLEEAARMNPDVGLALVASCLASLAWTVHTALVFMMLRAPASRTSHSGAAHKIGVLP